MWLRSLWEILVRSPDFGSGSTGLCGGQSQCLSQFSQKRSTRREGRRLRSHQGSQEVGLGLWLILKGFLRMEVSSASCLHQAEREWLTCAQYHVGLCTNPTAMNSQHPIPSAQGISNTVRKQYFLSPGKRTKQLPAYKLCSFAPLFHGPYTPLCKPCWHQDLLATRGSTSSLLQILFRGGLCRL